MQYSEKVLDHFTNPRNVGEIADANGVGEVGNAKCGDIMKIYLKVSDDGVIEDVKFKTFGCGAAIATSSMATEMVKGKTLEEALKLTNKAVAEALDGLPPVILTGGRPSRCTVRCWRRRRFARPSRIITSAWARIRPRSSAAAWIAKRATTSTTTTRIKPRVNAYNEGRLQNLPFWHA